MCEPFVKVNHSQPKSGILTLVGHSPPATSHSDIGTEKVIAPTLTFRESRSATTPFSSCYPNCDCYSGTLRLLLGPCTERVHVGDLKKLRDLYFRTSGSLES